MNRLLTLSLALILLTSIYYAQNPLPIVDLVYGRHQAIAFDVSGRFYNFSNIRYAQSPDGDLRFRLPKSPETRSSKIDNGSVGRMCPQSHPAWLKPQIQFMNAYLTGQPCDVSTLQDQRNQAIDLVPPADSRETEDCLFLDVVVPDDIFRRRRRKDIPGGKPPVLVWIHGGGYAEGDKTGGGQFDPSGLFYRARAIGHDSFVFVALNYRLGALGWAAGSTVEQEGVVNAGLYDQRLALEWVNHNIHLFGGDPGKVTVMGESAGGASIMHQITAFGGKKGPVPFQRAILQSPAWPPLSKTDSSERNLRTFLEELNVSSISEARKMSTEKIKLANTKTILGANWGSFVFGPAVDKFFTPKLPGRLFLKGQFESSLEVMVGHNSEEALLMTPPTVNSTATFEQFLTTTFPGISKTAKNYIEHTLYPAEFSGRYGYVDEFTRTKLILSDAGFTCNAYYLNRAYTNHTYAYKFAVLPAVHGMDVDYTFYTESSSTVTQPEVAKAMQTYIIGFVTKGKPVPSAPGLPEFPQYGHESQEVIFNNDTSILIEHAENNSDRCRWWQEAHYAG